MDTDVKRFLRENGRKGGKKTAKRGSDYYRKIGKRGAKKRWAARKPVASA